MVTGGAKGSESSEVSKARGCDFVKYSCEKQAT